MIRILFSILHFLANYRRFLSHPVSQIAFGIIIGGLLGFSISFTYEIEITPFTSSVADVALDFFRGSETVTGIQCVIFLNSKRRNLSKYIAAITETYSQQCNKTIFITNSKKLVKDSQGNIIK